MSTSGRSWPTVQPWPTCSTPTRRRWASSSPGQPLDHRNQGVDELDLLFRSPVLGVLNRGQHDAVLHNAKQIDVELPLAVWHQRRNIPLDKIANRPFPGVKEFLHIEMRVRLCRQQDTAALEL